MDGQIQYREFASALRGFRKTLTGIEATADSPGGLVRATTDAHGRLLELELDRRIYRATDSRALAATIAMTVHAAAEAARAEIERIAGELFSR
ncbi:YbaB/EbfC DNA-binding family protein [Amycolatopsis sulphurea]|uniref:YbaB/EbfC DNA-binding family protein n=1 Tax=Amycolatopsis sulphurea TaxID=76022 RepID=A0A2A9FG05_9PSEU|nr:YbaB/EbfC family nucleoid-associated protein [Amycolatopsis sulphurea]PFG49339.1 YbaB/EbfC DNA-binding family protein [Amycolatopsis sulphurea]